MGEGMAAVAGTSSPVFRSGSAFFFAGIVMGYSDIQSQTDFFFIVSLSSIPNTETPVNRSFPPVIQSVKPAIDLSKFAWCSTHIFFKNPDEIVAGTKIQGNGQFLYGHSPVLDQQKPTAGDFFFQNEFFQADPLFGFKGAGKMWNAYLEEVGDCIHIEIGKIQRFTFEQIFDYPVG
jgi:hypothetical protein